MKKEKKRALALCLAVAVFLSIFYPMGTPQEYKAGTAASYTNAKEFFDSTGQNNGKHISVHDGTIYFAVKVALAKTYATNPWHTYYGIKGYDVTLSGGGTTVTFGVKSGGDTLTTVEGSNVIEDGFSYLLYYIKKEDVERFARHIAPESAEKIFSASSYIVRMDAIIARVYNYKEGTIEEDGNGGIIINNPTNDYRWVWRLSDPTQLKEADDLYSYEDTFAYCTDISCKFDNFKLDVYYAVDGLPEVSANSSTHVTVADGWRTANADVDGDKITDMYILFEGNKPKIDTGRIATTMTILKPFTGGPNISKIGYHLDEDEEWIDADGKIYAAGGTYEPSKLAEAASSKNTSLCLYANWKPNEYTIKYDANGGKGSITPTNATYDVSVELNSGVPLYREGYIFKGWSSTENGNMIYADKTYVSNLSAENGKEVTLYAVWERRVYEITLNNMFADAPGTTEYYEHYEDKNYTTEEGGTEITEIEKPEKEGYTFGGYYTGKEGKGISYVSDTGKITSTNKTFLQDTSLYAKWTPITYTIRYNALGGTGAMSTSIITYDVNTQLRNCTFKKTGNDFAGWATTEGGPVVYADKAYVLNLTRDNGKIIDLYAVWTPATPQITLDPQEGSGGTTSFFEKYGDKFYTNNLFTTVITQITKPLRAGFDFAGYFEDRAGSGNNPIINALGNIVASATKFLENTTLFAKWTAQEYTITLDHQGGTSGLASIKATYDKTIPNTSLGVDLEIPKRGELTFKGYYTQANGQGTKYYNEYMSSDITYTNTSGIKLYACWMDEVNPGLGFTGGPGADANQQENLAGDKKWTNQKVTLTATASDGGFGLSSVYIYRINADESLTVVASATGLNGATSKTITYLVTTEGITRYKAVTTDMAGNVTEKYRNVYYDVTAPTGELIEFTVNGNKFTINVNVTDSDTGN